MTPDRDPVAHDRRPPSKASGLLYGLGLGGFVDGIVLHRILQWDHTVSNVDDYPVTVGGWTLHKHGLSTMQRHGSTHDTQHAS
jgi:uncharacterized membrane protein